MQRTRTGGVVGFIAVLSSERFVGENNPVEHLIEAVGDAVAVLLADVARRKVGGDECEELFVVAAREEFYGGVEHVAVVQHLRRLQSQVVDGEHGQLAVPVVVIVVLAAHPGYLSRRHLVHVERLTVGILASYIAVEGTHGTHQCGLAVAAGAAEQHAHFRHLGEPLRHLDDGGTHILGGFIFATAILHLRHDAGSEQLSGLLWGVGQLKTFPRNPPAE